MDSRSPYSERNPAKRYVGLVKVTLLRGFCVPALKENHLLIPPGGSGVCFRVDLHNAGVRSGSNASLCSRSHQVPGQDQDWVLKRRRTFVFFFLYLRPLVPFLKLLTYFLRNRRTIVFSFVFVFFWDFFVQQQY